MTIKTVVADDEPLARERLKLLLRADRELEIVAECRNGAEVLRTLQARDVDLLLLDIHMPGLSGFDVVKQMNKRRPPMIIFVTAHDNYAIQAFEINAVDYLLKPIDRKRFQDAIGRVRERLNSKSSIDAQAKLASVLASLKSLTTVDEPARASRFVVHAGPKDVLVNAGDIVWVEAADYYACLHVAGKKHLLRESMKKLEAQLNPKSFVRIHRSAIVNIDCVREIHREGRAEGWVLLSNGDRVQMSTGGWQRLLAASSAR